MVFISLLRNMYFFNCLMVKLLINYYFIDKNLIFLFVWFYYFFLENNNCVCNLLFMNFLCYVIELFLIVKGLWKFNVLYV